MFTESTNWQWVRGHLHFLAPGSKFTISDFTKQIVSRYSQLFGASFALPPPKRVLLRRNRWDYIPDITWNSPNGIPGSHLCSNMGILANFRPFKGKSTLNFWVAHTLVHYIERPTHNWHPKLISVHLARCTTVPITPTCNATTEPNKYHLFTKLWQLEIIDHYLPTNCTVIAKINILYKGNCTWNCCCYFEICCVVPPAAAVAVTYTLCWSITFSLLLRHCHSCTTGPLLLRHQYYLIPAVGATHPMSHLNML